MKKLMIVVFVGFTVSLFAAVEPVYPVQNEILKLVPDNQKAIMNLPTLAERLKYIAEGRKNHTIHSRDAWRVANPVKLKWRVTQGEKAPWKIMIAKKSDFSDMRVWYLKGIKTDSASGRNVGEAKQTDEVCFEVPMANLEIGTTYYWKVMTRGRCKAFNCGKKCSCEESKRMVESPVSTFKTEDFAPRWMAINGDVHNMRDLGGRHTAGGKRVRQGLIFRGQGLNYNSVMGEDPGDNRLTMEDVKYMTKTLGVKTDLDLRSDGELAGMDFSPLGKDVNFIHTPSSSYRGIFEGKGKQAMAKNFRVFCDRKNYPIYFHCIGGADRAGSLAYVLNAVLGVDRHELETDWESTFYPKIPDQNPDPNFWCRESHFNDGFSKYGDKNTKWNDRVVLYLKDCGITDAEIATFRGIMLE